MRLVWAVIPLVLFGIVGVQDAKSTTCHNFEYIFGDIGYDAVILIGTVNSSEIVDYDPPVVSVGQRTTSERITEYKIDEQIYGDKKFELDTFTIKDSWTNPTESYEQGIQKVIPLYYSNYNPAEFHWNPLSCFVDFDLKYVNYVQWFKDLQQNPNFQFNNDQHTFVKYQENKIQESFTEESKFTVGNVTSKITSGQTMKEKLASVPICEDSSDKFPNSALTPEQKIIKSFYQSDLVVTGQIVNKTAYSSNEKNWDILHIQVEDIINPNPNFSNNVEHPIVLVSSKCWSYSGILQNDWSSDIVGDVFLYLNRIHDVRFTISNPINDITIDSNVISIPSPLVQNKAISTEMWHDSWSKVYCKPSLIPITKPNAEFACVTPSTAEKLIKRGWTD